MESARKPNDSLTGSQQKAVEARGNVLVMAGAGTGKTKTLVARCLDCLARDHASLDELLVVTFTEAAAAEMRHRLRRAIEEIVASESIATSPAALNFWNSQLALFDIAHIGTLHGFCLRLVRELFYELGLDPQLAILDQGEARQRANETLDEQFQAHYAGEDEFSRAVQNLIQVHGGGRDEKIRALILRLHNYSQTRPDAGRWLEEQIGKFAATEPEGWQRLLLVAIADWRDEWLPVLEDLRGENDKAAELVGTLSRLQNAFTRAAASKVLAQVVAADLTANYPKGKAGKLRPALGEVFAEAEFLGSLATTTDASDPLAEDWSWVRGHMETLLRLAQEFAQEFAARKLADGVLDFHDLEQFALKLLWDFANDRPTAVAEVWRRKLRFVFVDEYQDINAAQDKIIQALSSGTGFQPVTDRQDACPTVGNRFLVGDVKQSIYRFRLADPKIFRDYAHDWRGAAGQVIPLSDNFRSRESLLNFVNSVFAPLMREELGGVTYDEDAKLRFGSPETRGDFSIANDTAPRTELLLRFKTGRGESSEPDDDAGANDPADLGEAEKEARLLVKRLQELQAEQRLVWDDKAAKFRPVEWRDMAVLLRAMSGKSEIYAMEFERAGVPLLVARGGFYESSEVADLLSLLQLLDNPLQDVPCIAVLRSPLVGCSLDELTEIRLAAREKHFWTALNSIQNEKLKIEAGLRSKTAKFLDRFARWRKLARQVSLSRCLEQVLAETHYDDWLRSRARGQQRQANVGRFLNLAQKFDQFQRQGLFRFLKFIEAQRAAEVEPEVAVAPDENAVRLMSIHQSKGLEFPIVAIADLAKPFNEQDRSAEIIFDEELGLCPKVKPPHAGGRYPSLPHWLAQRQQRREQAGEELRLLYVAMTRARDMLILTGSVTEKKWAEAWQDAGAITSRKILAAKSYADWLGIWFGRQPGASSEKQGELPALRWRIADDAELASQPGETPDERVSAESQEGSRGHSAHLMEALNDEALQKLRETLTWQYGFGAATECAAKSSVTVLRRQAQDELADEASPVFHFQVSAGWQVGKPGSSGAKSKLNAADAGTAHHKFLQHVSLKNAGDVAALAAEALRLEREKVLSAEEVAALDLKAMAGFWISDVGQMIREQATYVKRELEFTAKFSPAELSAIIGTKTSPELAAEFVVVQGVADLVVLLPEAIWLVDFKTDAMRADGLPAKIKAYEPQLKLYARALEKIYSLPVTNCWLHFLSAEHTINI
jgi:ATP-dependent helicase/nuclease subunit A